MKKLFSEISISLLLRIGAVLFAVVPVLYIVGHVSSIPQYRRTLIYIVLTIIAEVLMVTLKQKKWNDVLHVAGAVFLALAFASFANGGVLSVADYIAGINLFGDASQVPAIFAYGSFLLCAEILAIVDCFLCNDFPKKSEAQI